MNDSLKRLAELKLKADIERYKAVPEFAVPRGHYEDATANGLTRCIIDYVRLAGHWAERVNTTGRVINDRGRSRYIPTTATRGSADVHAIKSGRSVMIEIKVGKDKQSDRQRHYQAQVEASGAVYMVVRTFEDFVTQWTNI